MLPYTFATVGSTAIASNVDDQALGRGAPYVDIFGLRVTGPRQSDRLSTDRYRKSNDMKCKIS